MYPDNNDGLACWAPDAVELLSELVCRNRYLYERDSRCCCRDLYPDCIIGCGIAVGVVTTGSVVWDFTVGGAKRDSGQNKRIFRFLGYVRGGMGTFSLILRDGDSVRHVELPRCDAEIVLVYCSTVSPSWNFNALSLLPVT